MSRKRKDTGLESLVAGEKSALLLHVLRTCWLNSVDFDEFSGLAGHYTSDLALVWRFWDDSK